MEMKKRVLIYTDTFLKKSETFIYRQLIGVNDSFEVKVLTNQTANQEHFPFENHEEIPFNWQQKIQRTGNPYVLQSSYQKKIRRVFEQFKPDLIHAYFGHNALKIAPLAIDLKIPIVLTFLGSDASKRLNDKRYVRTLRKYWSYPTKLCVSKGLRNNLKSEGFDIEKTLVHYLGVSIENFAYKEREPIGLKIEKKEKVSYLQVGRFVEKKGHEHTVKAFHNFLKKRKDSELFEVRFAGEGPLEKPIRDLVNELGIQDNVKFLGYKSPDEVIEEMTNADALLQHSVTAFNGDTEGLPVVITEGMATGLPVVSTYHSGIPELIESEKNGFLIDERNIEEYVVAFRRLTQLKDLKINEAARETVDKDFSLASQNLKLREIYTTAIEENEKANHWIGNLSASQYAS